MQIDLDGTVLELEKRALAGLNQTLIFTEKLAIKHAPVRQFIRRTPRPSRLRSLSIADGASRAAIMRRYRQNPVRSQKMLDRIKASRPKPRRISVPPQNQPRVMPRDEIERARQEFMLETMPRSAEGHNNTFIPVYRSQGTVLSGDFRRVAGGKLVAVAYAEKVVGGKVSVRHPKVGDDSELETALSQTAMYDIRTGKVSGRVGRIRLPSGKLKRIDERRGLHRDKAGVVRYGGSLRASIHQVLASLSTREGRGKVYGYVRAGNKEVDYAGYQEFGTSHNRPHPFLRPALYESRDPLYNNVKAHLEGR